MLALLLAVGLAQPASSSCPVADDPAFATSQGQPVQVGGGAMFVAARERRYLDALRGPTGEQVQYKRTRTTRVEGDDRTILDVYEVTYAGLEKPAVLYLDAYHFDDALKAPKGFVCAVPIALQPPQADPFLAQDSLRTLAIEQGAAADFPPIPLDAGGTGAHGVLLDHFRLMARAARAAKRAGAPLDPRKPTLELMRSRMVVVAYPLRCGDRDPVGPVAVSVVPAQGQAPPRDGEPATGEALARLLPGLDVPAGSMAVAFPLELPRPTDTIKITYPDGACGPSNDVVLPLKVTNGKPLKWPQPALPAGQPPTDRPVRLQALIDTDGRAQQIVYVGGPAALKEAALDAVRAWEAEPARINGAPVVTPVMLQVKFGG
jgi:TonB-like protein